MKTVILAAGLGTRLRPLTKSTPKPLVEVGKKTIIEYTLNALPDVVSEIFIITGYLADQIKKKLGNEWNGQPIKYIDQKELNGTAGALWLIKDELNEKFLVLNGDDIYSRDDLERLVNNDLAMLVIETNKSVARPCLEDKNRNFIGLGDNNNQAKLLNTGAYMLDKRFFDYEPAQIPDKLEAGIPDTLVNMAKDHKIKLERANFWLPVGNHEQLDKANKILSSMILAT